MTIKYSQEKRSRFGGCLAAPELQLNTPLPPILEDVNTLKFFTSRSPVSSLPARLEVNQ